MRIFEITEARRNATHPAQARLSYAQTILKYKDDPNIFISFTDLPKIGMNPMTRYNTPAGIYTYPIQMISDRLKPNMKHDKFADLFPFAAYRKFAFLVRATKPITLVQSYSNENLKLDIEKFKKLTNVSDETIASYMNRATVNTPFGRFWAITYFHTINDERPTVSWNSLLRKLGFHSILDNGSGIIHPNEPTQAVFLSKSDFEVVEQLHHHPSSSSTYMNKMKIMSSENKKLLSKIKNLLEQGNKDAVYSLISYSADGQVQQMIMNDVIKYIKKTYNIWLINAFTTSVQSKLIDNLVSFIDENIEKIDSREFEPLISKLPIDLAFKIYNGGFLGIERLYRMTTSQLRKLSPDQKQKLYDKFSEYIRTVKNLSYSDLDILYQLNPKIPDFILNSSDENLQASAVNVYGKDNKLPMGMLYYYMGFSALMPPINMLDDDEKFKLGKAFVDMVYAGERDTDYLYDHKFPWKDMGTATLPLLNYMEDNKHEMKRPDPYINNIIDDMKGKYGKT